jgi:MYXO-CTERM domain-containing protein
VTVNRAPTPPPSGGGSSGLVELFVLALFALAYGARRRRRPGLVGRTA